MLCRYVATYVAYSIAPPYGGPATLYASTKERVSAVLVQDPGPLLVNADRADAIPAIVSRGIFGKSDLQDIEIKIANEMAEIATSRKKAASGAPFLILSVELDEDPDLSGAHIDQPGYSVYSDALDKERVRTAARPVADRVLTGAIVASDPHARFDRLAESV